MDNTNNTPLHNDLFKKARLHSLISTVIHQCSIRVVFPLGVLSVYIFSYFINQGKIPKAQFNLSIFPISLLTFTMTLTIPIAGITEKIIGQRLTILLSYLIMLLALTILYFSNSAYLSLATYVILGFGQGLSYMLTVKSSTYFFPKNAGLMTSLINSTSSIAAAAFNIFAEFILINPKQIQPRIKNVSAQQTNNIRNTEQQKTRY
jgi:MFS family permease